MKRRIFRRAETDQYARTSRTGAERNAAEVSRRRKAACEAAGGLLLVVGFAALGLLASVLLGVALGALCAGAILILVGNA